MQLFLSLANVICWLLNCFVFLENSFFRFGSSHSLSCFFVPFGCVRGSCESLSSARSPSAGSYSPPFWLGPGIVWHYPIWFWMKVRLCFHRHLLTFSNDMLDQRCRCRVYQMVLYQVFSWLQPLQMARYYRCRPQFKSVTVYLVSSLSPFDNFWLPNSKLYDL